jgi:hypothetical protein
LYTWIWSPKEAFLKRNHPKIEKMKNTRKSNAPMFMRAGNE